MFKADCSTDNYETPIAVWRQLLPYVKQYKTIVDPFYCDGRARIYWEDLGKKCKHSDIDAYSITNDFPPDHCIVTNPPFSQLEKAITFLFSFDNAIFCLVPISILNSDWFVELLHKAEEYREFSILPAVVRTGFIKDGALLRESPTALCIISLGVANGKRKRRE
ncbi:DNA N-6-adenine-methyltransferase [Circoviridae sp.]|nr:DNA N-6-adenine-methyltransferase [Circoviridae sp.]